MAMTRQERVALHTNQKRMQLSSSMPNEKSLVEGKPEYRETSKGLYHYVKFNNEVYSQLLTKHTRTLEEEINDTVNNITVTAITVTDPLDVSDGGTGATSLTDNAVLTGTGTSAITAEGNLSFNGSTLAVTGALSATTAADLSTASGITTIGSSNALTVSAAGVLTVNNTTDSSSYTTGSVIIDGGVGVAGIIYTNSDIVVGDDLFVTDDVSLTTDASVFRMGDGGDFTITHDNTTGATLAGNPITITSGGAATWSTSAGNLTIDSAAGLLALDGHSGMTLAASNSGTIEINVIAGEETAIGNNAVAQEVSLGNAAAAEVDLTAILVDINGGASGVTIDGDVFINSPYAALKVSGAGGFDLTLGVTDTESDHGRIFGSGTADFYTNYIWLGMWDLQVSAEYDTDFGSW